ncbi:MAG TPA: DUF4190 domain-containing protein [Verrucomicrobiae bacterium]|jgi:hypothetical protein|nr:DUF4190 domain-containing protein [Verrucomicrobiae bacterium]
MYRVIGADGKEYGPISADQLRQWITEGRANAATPTLAQGATEWKNLSALPEFSLLFAATAPSTAAAPAAYKSSALALTSLILGIFSLTFGLCCCYGLPFNITGLILSLVALSQIKSNPNRYDGKGMAIAGLVLSLMSLALIVIILAVVFASAALGHPIHHVYRL